MRVYIPLGRIPIERQLSTKWENKIGNYEFIFNPNEHYDYFVALDNIPEFLCKVDKDHRLLFLGEPPYIKHYNNHFLDQFGHIYTCNNNIRLKNVIITPPLLSWMVGICPQNDAHDQKHMTYDDFSRLFHNHERINKCCLITSNKAFTKGHIERVRFTESVIKYHSDIIDVFGNGYNPISDKLEVLSKYKYALTIENCRYPNYWTEKLSDSFLAECYPIYHGCPNVEKYFPKGSYSVVDINKTDETINTIKQILNSNLYELSVNNLLSAKKLVLDKYNIFTQIAEQIDIIENNRREMLYPESPQITDKIKEMLTRRLNIII